MTFIHKYVSHQLGSTEVNWRELALEEVPQSITGWSNLLRLLGDTSQIFHIPKFNIPQIHSPLPHISPFTGLLVIGRNGMAANVHYMRDSQCFPFLTKSFHSCSIWHSKRAFFSVGFWQRYFRKHPRRKLGSFLRRICHNVSWNLRIPRIPNYKKEMMCRCCFLFRVAVAPFWTSGWTYWVLLYIFEQLLFQCLFWFVFVSLYHQWSSMLRALFALNISSRHGHSACTQQATSRCQSCCALYVLVRETMHDALGHHALFP